MGCLRLCGHNGENGEKQLLVGFVLHFAAARSDSLCMESSSGRYLS